MRLKQLPCCKAGNELLVIQTLYVQHGHGLVGLCGVLLAGKGSFAVTADDSWSSSKTGVKLYIARGATAASPSDIGRMIKLLLHYFVRTVLVIGLDKEDYWVSIPVSRCLSKAYGLTCTREEYLKTKAR